MDIVLGMVREFGILSYLLLFAYCALKSGALPLFAGYAAQAGALDPAVVAASTFAGGYLGDEASFLVARRYGSSSLENRLRFARGLETARAMLDRYGAVYIFLYRYPKGMRTLARSPWD